MNRSPNHIDYTEGVELLARYAKALSHPVRITILNLLDQQSCCFTGDLVDELPFAQSTISQHLKELKEAGLIQGEIEAPKIKYCINKEHMLEAKELLNSLL